jgi:tRNA pseudouridine38-40 synthase
MTEVAQPVPQRHTWKLTLAYDGTDFSGWQIQPGERTVQGELQAALRRVTGESPLPQGSGRTDAGVHALGQVASFELAAKIPAANLQSALNRTLPPAIRILESRTVRSTFHARHSAIAKTYEYRVFREPICPPFLARYFYACPWPMDIMLLEKSARLFEGEHDFLSFAATDPDLTSRNRSSSRHIDQIPDMDLDADGGQDHDQNLAQVSVQELPTAPSPGPLGKQGAIRRVDSSTWEQRKSENGDFLVYRIRGNGFLHHMVRNLVGTMLDVGRGYRRIDEIPFILAARSRAVAGPTAPARGLFLQSVEYDERELAPATE